MSQRLYSNCKENQERNSELKISFAALTGGVCGDNSRTFVDEIVVFTKKNTPLIGVKSWKKVKPVVNEKIVTKMMVSSF
jgi:hypothetical protein